MVAASLLIRSVGALMAEEPGFELERLLTAEVLVPQEVQPERAGVLRTGGGKAEGVLSDASRLFVP